VSIVFGESAALKRVAELERELLQYKQAESALRTSEERMRFALQSAEVGVWDLNYTTGVLEWSDTLEAHYGLRPGTFGGTFDAFIACVHPDDRQSVSEAFARAEKAGDDFRIENRSTWADGTVRWLSSAGRVHLGPDGRPLRGVGISLDVTDRRVLEEQYQQAQKMEALGRLAGGVAHDFNNLLTVILGYCGLLLSELDPADPRQADIEAIEKAGASAAIVTSRLLAFSRKQIVEPALLDLNAILSDVRVMLGRLIGEDVKVVMSLERDLAAVKCDRGQVEQIVMNLAVNARDAMPRGGTLRIETANVELDEHYARHHLNVKPGPYVVLAVSDTGIGMTPDVRDRLFEPFFTTKEPGKGTGLGLASIHGIMSRCGGSVNVYTEFGRGTSFKVYFPRADVREIAGASAPGRELAGSQTILLVEDSEDLRELATKLLERQGYRVHVAGDGEEALQLFAQHPDIDVLLTDIVMPGASGPELTSRLVSQRPDLRVVYMSGYTEETIIQHGVLKPGIGFLHKPFTSETLGRKLREVIETPALKQKAHGQS